MLQYMYTVEPKLVSIWGSYGQQYGGTFVTSTPQVKGSVFRQPI